MASYAADSDTTPLAVVTELRGVDWRVSVILGHSSTTNLAVPVVSVRLDITRPEEVELRTMAAYSTLLNSLPTLCCYRSYTLSLLWLVRRGHSLYYSRHQQTNSRCCCQAHRQPLLLIPNDPVLWQSCEQHVL